MVDLERDAADVARLLRSRKKRSAAWSPGQQLAKEVDLVFGRLVHQRHVHANHLKSLLRSECAIGTDLIALQSYNPRVFLYRDRERDQLKRRLLDVQRERRSLEFQHEREVAGLHDRLFRLLSQLEGLGGAGW